MTLKAKYNVNKKRKAKEKIYKKNTKISLCHLQFYIRQKIGHQYIFYRGVVNKAVHKSRIQPQQPARDQRPIEKEVISIRYTLL